MEINAEIIHCDRLSVSIILDMHVAPGCFHMGTTSHSHICRSEYIMYRKSLHVRAAFRQRTQRDVLT